MQFRPTRYQFPRAIKKFPTQRPRHAKPAVIRRAPADANQTSLRPALERRPNHRAQSESIQRERMKFSRRQLRQSHYIRRFDDRRSALCIPPPLRADGPMRRIHRLHHLRFRPQQTAHHRAKSVAAIAHRQQLNRIPGSRPPPAPRHRRRRRLGRQRALELVRHNQNLQSHRRVIIPRFPICNPKLSNAHGKLAR